MERLFTVEFGPSRSKRFDKAVAEARRVARECTEVEPGRYRARFVLGTDSGTEPARPHFPGLPVPLTLLWGGENYGFIDVFDLSGS
jgi:hypothetical protein